MGDVWGKQIDLKLKKRVKHHAPTLQKILTYAYSPYSLDHVAENILGGFMMTMMVCVTPSTTLVEWETAIGLVTRRIVKIRANIAPRLSKLKLSVRKISQKILVCVVINSLRLSGILIETKWPVTHFIMEAVSLIGLLNRNKKMKTCLIPKKNVRLRAQTQSRQVSSSLIRCKRLLLI